MWKIAPKNLKDEKVSAYLQMNPGVVHIVNTGEMHNKSHGNIKTENVTWWNPFWKESKRGIRGTETLKKHFAYLSNFAILINPGMQRFTFHTI